MTAPAFFRSQLSISTVALCLLAWSPLRIQAQDEKCPDLPPVPEKAPRPAKGAGSVAEFVDNLSRNDGIFDVLVGQSRIITLKADLAAPGKRAPVVAVGDPTVIDFRVLNTRQIRVVGERIGVSDLSIVTIDCEVYSLEIRVVAYLCILEAQLKRMFPDSTVKISQIRDHVILEGKVPNAGDAVRILETVNAYLLSVYIGQERKTTTQ